MMLWLGVGEEKDNRLLLHFCFALIFDSDSILLLLLKEISKDMFYFKKKKKAEQVHFCSLLSCGKNEKLTRQLLFVTRWCVCTHLHFSQWSNMHAPEELRDHRATEGFCLLPIRPWSVNASPVQTEQSTPPLPLTAVWQGPSSTRRWDSFGCMLGIFLEKVLLCTWPPAACD